MDRCAECGYAYEDLGQAGLGTRLSGLGQRFAARLRPPADPAALRSRPSPDVWSAIEYSCHVRDVLIAQRERLYLALVEDRPSFAPIYRDERAVLARYREEDPTRLADQLEVVAMLTGAAFAGVDTSMWQRECVYNYPEPTVRTVSWLAAHTLHEGEHHLHDIGRGQARTVASS